ncbi:hypothetical protein BO79DRAFT_218580 [Aspergillus costaricaensis CBS 115574]|uniref:Uncharacterized protein n=1 Tax=Aspergillus costaricaensis CBS 115574 TaxID=1448317 RepID=A0ACD1IB43_9EURO|nr:hypothetical protein BO79DRAFT_218580 [Aspergillus costaricaensis CBS 115574]RAK87794.1 hypothetical protein BO79DRAFT_218580 [Aspergillus costaricaensis CBS 115574]
MAPWMAEHLLCVINAKRQTHVGRCKLAMPSGMVDLLGCATQYDGCKPTADSFACTLHWMKHTDSSFSAPLQEPKPDLTTKDWDEDPQRITPINRVLYSRLTGPKKQKATMIVRTYPDIIESPLVSGQAASVECSVNLLFIYLASDVKRSLKGFQFHLP